MRVALLAVLALAPTAAALDVLPSHASFGDVEARVLVRLAEGGALHLDGSPGLLVGLAHPGAEPTSLAPVPAALEVPLAPPESSWHGLVGTVEVVARRPDARQDATLSVRDASGSGASYEWPAAPAAEVPDAPVAAAMMIMGAAALRMPFCGRRASRGP